VEVEIRYLDLRGEVVCGHGGRAERGWLMLPWMEWKEQHCHVSQDLTTTSV
jgi:hypothetical protein